MCCSSRSRRHAAQSSKIPKFPNREMITPPPGSTTLQIPKVLASARPSVLSCEELWEASQQNSQIPASTENCTPCFPGSAITARRMTADQSVGRRCSCQLYKRTTAQHRTECLHARNLNLFYDASFRVLHRNVELIASRAASRVHIEIVWTRGTKHRRAFLAQWNEVLMKLGAAVIATDLPELLPHMEYNLQLNDEGLGV